MTAKNNTHQPSHDGGQTIYFRCSEIRAKFVMPLFCKWRGLVENRIFPALPTQAVQQAAVDILNAHQEEFREAILKWIDTQQFLYKQVRDIAPDLTLTDCNHFFDIRFVNPQDPDCFEHLKLLHDEIITTVNNEKKYKI